MARLRFPPHPLLCFSPHRHESAYPLGGWVTTALIVAIAAAFAATGYAAASCRFVVVTFTSDAGGLEEYYGTNRGGSAGVYVPYKAAVGLYQWLRPVDAVDWSQGSCTGYQQTMLARIDDSFFNASRTFAVFAVIVSLLQTCWILMTACLSLNRIQGYLFCALSFVGAFSTAMTFLFRRSALCTTEFHTTDCAIDQGGLVMIAAVIFWLIALCISVRFVLPTVKTASGTVDFEQEDAEDRAKFASRARKQRRVPSKPAATNANDKTSQSISFDSEDSRTRRVPPRSVVASPTRRITAEQPRQQPNTSRQQQHEAVTQYSAHQAGDAPPNRRTVSVVDDVSDANATEVYIADTLDNIDKLVDV